jgi:hypothetical protein
MLMHCHLSSALRMTVYFTDTEKHNKIPSSHVVAPKLVEHLEDVGSIPTQSASAFIGVVEIN